MPGFDDGVEKTPVWKKEISFRRKPKREAPADGTAVTSVWKKELTLGRRKPAAPEPVAVSESTPVVDPESVRHGIGRRLMELALEQAPRRKVAFGAQPQSVAFSERIGCKRKLTSFVAELPLKSEMP